MIAAYYDWCFDLALLHQIVHGKAKLRALSVPKPADACRQSLELDAPASEVNPAAQDAIVREEFENKIICDVNVGGFARERDPAERTASCAEQRTNIGRNESREIVGVLHTALEREGADVVSVVECDRSHLLQTQHAFDVARHGVERLLCIGLRIALAQFERLREGHAVRNVSVQRIMSRGLIGEYVRNDAAFGELRNHIGAIAD